MTGRRELRLEIKGGRMPRTNSNSATIIPASMKEWLDHKLSELHHDQQQLFRARKTDDILWEKKVHESRFIGNSESSGRAKAKIEIRTKTLRRYKKNNQANLNLLRTDLTFLIRLNFAPKGLEPTSQKKKVCLWPAGEGTWSLVKSSIENSCRITTLSENSYTCFEELFYMV